MSGKILKMRALPLAMNDAVHLNLVYTGVGDFDDTVRYVSLNGFVFSMSPHHEVAVGEIALNTIQRRVARVAVGDTVNVEPFLVPKKKFTLDTISIEVDFVMKKAVSMKLDGMTFISTFLRRYVNQVFTIGQSWVIDFEGLNYLLLATSMTVIDEENMQVNSVDKRGMGVVSKDTKVILKVVQDQKYIKLENLPLSTASRGSEIFKKDFNFEQLGIGGLNKEFGDIFRRAFASRIFPPSVVQRLGIQHVKGIMLHGPPGTGKTLMARQIGKMLNCVEPKIVNGPEVLNKYVGASEENIRNLFKDAEADSKSKGDESELHLIIFDEIDAICKARGSTRDGTGVSDSVVNQLLSKIDGVEALNNVLLIGMTNRKDMLDEALTRPGRFEVLIEIGLPDEAGRLQIFSIHTGKIRTNGFMDPDVDLAELASRAKNFSGAEIEGLVKSATSFSFHRQVDVNNITKPIDPEAIRITRQDFLRALEEVKPAFGVDEEGLERYMTNGLIEYGTSFDAIRRTCESFVLQLNKSERTTHLSVLLEGPPGSGKTALAAHIAKWSSFPYVKVISGENMVGCSDVAKSNIIRKVFDDAYKSPLSVIVLDELERLIEFIHMGPRFSNTILQTLLVLIKKQPPKGKQLLVIGTTSAVEVIESLDLTTVFNSTVRVPLLHKSIGDYTKVMTSCGVKFSNSEDEASVMEILPSSIGIKNLHLVCEMALIIHQEDAASNGIVEAFGQALRNCNCN